MPVDDRVQCVQEVVVVARRRRDVADPGARRDGVYGLDVERLLAVPALLAAEIPVVVASGEGRRHGLGELA